jgi:hypothetical protein
MRKWMLSLVFSIAAVAAGTAWRAPAPPASLTFGVIGDNGNGTRAQYDVGVQMASVREASPFDLVIMLGDNRYGSQGPADFVAKFERPYAALLAKGVVFKAALGNHDRPENVSYAGFHMNGQRYYTYAQGGVRFIVLDTNLMDPPQVRWFERTLQESIEPWKICYFHHPLYSNAGRHGPDVEMRVVLEPLMVKYGVTAVFSGHEHVYERFRPQKGITYFTEGSAGQLTRNDLSPSTDSAAQFDQDQTFMVITIQGDDMSFRTFSRTGRIVDSGLVPRRILESPDMP